MVNSRRYIASLFRLIRFPNLLIMAATQVLTRQCLMRPVLRSGGLELQLETGMFAMLVLSTVFLASGGYAINDYFDRKIDLVNKPHQVIVGRSLSPSAVTAFHLVCTLAGVLMGTWISYRTGQMYFSLIFFIVSGLLWFYATTYKQQLLLGTFMVAMLTALVPFIVLLFEIPLQASAYGSQAREVLKQLMVWVTGFSLFAFLLNAARELVKDAEDFEGDRAFGKRTLPVVAGTAITRAAIILLLLTVAALLLEAWFLFLPDVVSLAYFTMLLIIPLAAASYLVTRARSRQAFHRVSIILKGVMVAGIVYMVVVNILINEML